MAIERRLYIEYRMYFNPDVNQDTLHELATLFQDFIQNEWNGSQDSADFDTNDVTYEIVMEIAKLNEKKETN